MAKLIRSKNRKNDDGLYHEITLHEGEAGFKFAVKKEGQVVISLNEDPKAKAKWVVADQDDLFTLIDESKKTETESHQVRVFRFEVGEGEARVTLAYRNPWVKDSPDLRTLTFIAEGR